MNAKQRTQAVMNLVHMTGNELDSIKHIVRGIQWRVDAIVRQLNVNVQPDVLEEIVNPSHAFINEIVSKARGEFAGTPAKRRAKKRRAKK
jgi:hypothetical protein